MSAPPKTRDAVLEYLRTYGPHTKHEIAHGLGKTPGAINHPLYAARRRKLAHISGWVRNGMDDGAVGPSGAPTPIWSAGAGADAPRPAAFTEKERHVRHRARSRTLLNIRNRIRRGAENTPFVAMAAALNGGLK
jgi:hypothetical protein